MPFSKNQLCTFLVPPPRRSMMASSSSSSSHAPSRAREVEHRSTSACDVASSTISISEDDGGAWRLVVPGGDATAASSSSSSSPKRNDDIVDENDDDYWSRMAEEAVAGGGDDATTATTAAADAKAGGGTSTTADAAADATAACRAIAPGTTVRVPPMERTYGGWSADHFHERLRVPEGTTTGKGGGAIFVFLESRSSECLAVALSPYHDYVLGKTYVVHFGADGNTRTVLRRHVNYVECVESSFPCRVCSDEIWVPYWIVLRNGMLSAGIGNVPGRHAIGTLDDSMYDALRSGADAVKYVGIGNSALRRNARDLRVRNVVVAGAPSKFGRDGVHNIVDAMAAAGGGGYVNVHHIMTRLSSSAAAIDDERRGGDGGGGGISMPITDAELLVEYERERNKARMRAAKFGVEYREPAPDAFLKWSEARRLRANPERGFITGIDTFSPEEVAKADARRMRFAPPGGTKRKGDGEENDSKDERDDDDDDDDDDEAMDDDGDDVAEWEKTKSDPLPVEQAWENWKLVGRFRVDPPPPSLDDAEGRPGGDGFASSSKGRTIEIVPTKIHVFSIDWAPFKQIRTDDLMSYFRDYGPSYVEWLGELSCNILFEDRHSAARAFRALSRELPSPPPPSVGSMAAMDAPIGGSDGPGGGGAMGDNLDMITGEDDGEITAIDATADDDGENGSEKGQRKEAEESIPDFGSMGWRFCKWTVRKVRGEISYSY
jgi:hypothetical protein